MTIQLRMLLVTVSLLVFLYLIHKIRKAQMKIEDSVYWIFLVLCFELLSLFPGVAVMVSGWLGIESSVNFVFLAIIFLLLAKTFFLAVKISQIEYRISSLSQEIAIKNVEKIEKNDTKQNIREDSEMCKINTIETLQSVSINELLSSYPRKHPVLPESYQKIYERHYKENRDGATKASACARKFEGCIHKKIAKSSRGGEDIRNWCWDIKSA